MGCSVTSAASAGVLHSSRKLTFSRTARYSGRYRPACRITQRGARSVVSPRQARRNSGSMGRTLPGVAADLDVLLLGVGPAELGGAARAVLLDVDDHVLDGVAGLAVHLRGGLVGGREVRAHVDVR